MEAVRDIQKKYCSRALAIAVVVGLLLIVAGLKAAGKGLVLGTVFSIINFVVMAQALPLQIGKKRGRTFAWSIVSIFLRYVLLAIPVIIAIRYKNFDLATVILGIFMVQLAILSDHLLRLRPARREKQA